MRPRPVIIIFLLGAVMVVFWLEPASARPFFGTCAGPDALTHLDYRLPRVADMVTLVKLADAGSL